MNHTLGYAWHTTCLTPEHVIAFSQRDRDTLQLNECYFQSDFSLDILPGERSCSPADPTLQKPQ